MLFFNVSFLFKSIDNFCVKMNLIIATFTHFPRTHYSIPAKDGIFDIPVFHYSPDYIGMSEAN